MYYIFHNSPLPLVSGEASDKHIKSFQQSSRMFTLGGMDQDFKWPHVSLSQGFPSDSFGPKVIKILSLEPFIVQNCK